VSTVAANSKLPDFSKLSIAERLELMDQIWDSLTPQSETVPLPDWHVAEVRRRLAAMATDGNFGRPLDDVIADLKR
jgi:putative addiction module component (TIGR02574 family)